MLDSSRKSYVLSLGSLVLGILIGISIDAEFRPNHIQFWVNPINNLSLVFRPGDTVEWRQQSNNDLMNITFYGPGPCVGGNANPCTIGNIPDSTIYTYSCAGAVDPNFTCNDPQGGPKSVTQLGGESPGFGVKIFDLVRNILARFRELFAHSSHTGTLRVTQNTPGATQTIATSTATGPTTTVNNPSETANLTATQGGIGVTVYCDTTKNITDVIDPQQSKTPNVALVASVGQQIYWTTPSTAGFTITMNDPSTCKENVSTFGPNSICTVAKAGTFKAIAPTCPENPKEKIALQ